METENKLTEIPEEQVENWRNPDGTLKSGHPPMGGRPKGTRDFRTIYEAALAKLATENNKTPEELEEEILAKGIIESQKGQFQFYKDTLDRLHGKAQENIDHTTGGEKLTIQVVKYADNPDTLPIP